MDAGLKRSFNRRLFDVVALRYDVITRLLSFGWDQSWKDRMIRRIGLRRIREIVDIATGTGDIARRLANAFPEARVTGVDLSPEMLRRARRIASASGQGSLRRNETRRGLGFLQGDMTHLPFADSSVDLLTGGYALRNAPDLKAALEEVLRVLRPGGRFCFLDFANSGSPRVPLIALWGRIWGLLLNRNADTYGYIAESLARFPSPRELQGLLESLGFTRVRRLPLMFGMVEIVEGQAPRSRVE